ncbi:hypothetical protein [Nocardia niigatensis]
MRAILVAGSPPVARQAAIAVICAAVRGRRASMPRSTVRSSAVSELRQAVR